jgi:transposase-like protein
MPNNLFIPAFAYILFFSFNCLLPASIVSAILAAVFCIHISDQTIINWKVTLASMLYRIFFSLQTTVPDRIVIDEIFLRIFHEKFYLFFAINPYSREIIAFFLSRKRDSNSAFNLLRLIYLRASNKDFSSNIVTDGAPIYPLAISFFNLFAKQQGVKASFSHSVVPGLKGKHPFRWLKNIIERFNSTFKESAKLQRGFGSFSSALAHITIFIFYYNFLRPHQSLDFRTPANLSGVEPDGNAIKRWSHLIQLAFNSS